LAEDILKHRVLAEIFGSKIEDGQDNKGIATAYHTTKFMEAMVSLCDFIGPADATPEYYGSGGDYVDGAVCD
jgi:hypothetical protein